jgi:cellulose synthase/poly-beta-1,6-N-acetylglucosamine synthase-like glycosyltransferase/Flp pilus assembly protein TadD
MPVAIVLSMLLPHTRPLDRIMMPVQGFFMGLFLYHLMLVVLGLRRPERMPGVTPVSRFALLIAAHDEGTVIGQLIASLRALDYPKDRYEIFVVADHCNDDTAAAARMAGAIAYERTGGGRRGKGQALDWLLERVWSTGRPFDAVVIFDADNLAAPSFLRKMDAHLQAGDQVIQGYLDVKNPTDTWVTRAIYVTYAYTNRFFQLAKQHIGFSSSLGGTGLCIAVPLLKRLGWRCDALTEDLEFQIRAILAGVRPSWAWEAVVYDEKPLDFRTAWRQRQRWMQGHANVAFRYLGALLRRTAVSRDPVAMDAVIYLGSPLWLSLAVLLMISHLANQGADLYTYMFPVWLPPLLFGISCVYPFVALGLEGRAVRGYVELRTLLGLLLLSVSWPFLGFLGVLQHRNRHWVKTTHTRDLGLMETVSKVAGAPSRARPIHRVAAARIAATAMIAVTVVAVMAPHLVARRLWPPLEDGGTLLLDGRVPEAQKRLEDALQERPDDPTALGFLAVAQRADGRPAAALTTFRRLKRVDPTLEHATAGMVDFLIRHRDHPKRERLLNDILSAVRSGPAAYAWAANVFIQRRRLADAALVVEDGLKRYGPEVSLLKVKGYLNLARGRPAEAAEVLWRVHRMARRDSEALINLGWAYYRLGKHRRAVQAWEQALALDPNNEALQRDLERTRQLL